MALSALTKRKIRKIIPFGMIWLVMGALFLGVEHAALGNQDNIADTAIQLDIQVLLFALIGITLIGSLVGFIEVVFLNKVFIHKSFGVKIVSKFVIYLLFFLVIILITFPIAASLELNTSVFDPRVWEKYRAFFFSITHLSAGVQLAFSLFISLLYAEINENLGQNVLLNFFTGKYHKPIQEERIFMFVDMKDSTSIAEKLGHQEFFKLLRSYYFCFSNAIVKNYGEVYQYVGDEIVITWKMNKGLTANRCVQCFYDMKQALLKDQESYLKNYGVMPDFKGAIHFGTVTTGEIGALKKEIVFTGDVLNTTARILSLASTYKQDLLLSKALLQRLNLGEPFEVKEIGAPTLRGKVETVEIVAVNSRIEDF